MILDPALKQWATKTQARYLDLVNQHGSYSAAAKAIGTDRRGLSRCIAAILKKARAAGYPGVPKPGFGIREVTERKDGDGNLEGYTVKQGPESAFENGGIGESDARDGEGPYMVKGVSTYYRADGSQGGQWVKTSLDQQKRTDAMKAAAEAMAEKLPRLKPLAAPPSTMVELLNLYTFTDSHVGMLAWGKETGADWDLKIAEKILVGCFEQMMIRAPAAHIAIINQLGDFLHFDSLTAVTPSHGHVLDADSRFSHVVKIAIRILRRIVDLALIRHDHVHVILAEGNHDLASSVWLRHMFKALYENEPRVTVDDSELPYYVYQHGETMLAFHHGHLSKKDNLPLLFAARHPEMWGSTTRRYGHTGHQHHVDEKEHPGMKILQHPTLAAPDAYAARGGWISEREVAGITYHRKHGQVGRTYVTPEMIS